MEAVEITRLKEDLISQIRGKYESTDSNEKFYAGTSVLKASAEFSFEPLTWLAAQKLYPKIFWSGREDDTEYFGAGAADLITSDTLGSVSEIMREVQDKLSGTKGLKYFGYTRFNTTEENTGPEWKNYGNHSFFLPKFLISKWGENSELSWLCVFKAETIGELVSQFEQEFESLNFNLFKFHSHPQAEIQSCEAEDKELWDKSVDKVLSMIAENKLDKVVLSRKLDLTYPKNIEPLSFIQYFQKMKSPAYFFYFQPQADTAFIGSSPERLYRRDDLRIQTEALAGTRPRGITEEEDQILKNELLNDPKDRHEHELVFRHIEKILSDVCDIIEKDDECRIVPLVKIQHLIRKISGVLNRRVKDEALLSVFHPTPAVAGTPVDKAIETIKNLENFDRGLYCGPVGWIGENSSEFAVGIRCGLIKGNILSLYCGAGIVEGSSPQKEWDEIESKFGNFLEVIEQKL